MTRQTPAEREAAKLRADIESLTDDLIGAQFRENQMAIRLESANREAAKLRIELAAALTKLGSVAADHQLEIERYRADRRIVDADLVRSREETRRARAELAAATKRIDRARAALGTETP